MIFAFHDYPAIIHKPTYRRRNHDNIHVRGYKEEGTTSTPFDREVLNNLDRYQLALDAIRRIVIGGSRSAVQELRAGLRHTRQRRRAASAASTAPAITSPQAATEATRSSVPLKSLPSA